ncbi:unnamed protein product [Rotaria sordida]|uniref:Uncharacterized protein n=2 Tax=Rotaria sordida TaxID=392033 RepID=A0A815DCA9_9BILA|nr:unnamed protein product [Rotaria sordida]CAF0789082.1 unnamed protein product [Rotaria sordida]CAF1295907.1 unnamed protein product [Rotaria sordida]CAF1570411.1 unnamed protein product [Rotaria sordida]
MSNNSGRKSDFTPAIYTRYFERTETRKSTSSHIFFNDNNEETSKNYQIKRDLIFKRLFPSKYVDSDNNQTDNEYINQNGNNTSLNKPAQSLGDFIPLSNINSSTLKSKPSLETDVILTSSDENEEDLLNQTQLPTSTHDSIIGHLHPCSTIENVRTILIRELYQRTSDAHTEWLKCKMNLPQEYINPKYYADFQRRYKKDMKRNKSKKTKSNSINNKIENGYHVFDLTINDEDDKSTIQVNNSLESDDIIEISPIKSVKTSLSSSPIILTNDSSTQSKSIPEFIILDSDEDNNDNLSQDNNSTYFIDRSSTSFTSILQPTITSDEDYHKEDSKYAQLPSRNTSSESIIRPIISKHQRRKQNTPTKPLVSAIDRIIDQIDQSNSLDNSTTIEQQNLLIKQIKKRKKKKKKKLNNSNVN